jgi:ubiquinone/menaquinone biosynthesis C-methylase UbiE
MSIFSFLQKEESIDKVGNEVFSSTINESSEEYWDRINVTDHLKFKTVEESLDFFDWRCKAYNNYIECMPVHGYEGKVILDFGCGPGHDLIGFSHFSRPAQLIGLDTSKTSLAEAHHRLKLHNFQATLIHTDEKLTILPFDDNSIDVIHSSGVLHHIKDPTPILKEFKRVLKPNGHIQIMVYNTNSLFYHLHVQYFQVFKNPEYAGLSLTQAFQRSTDGPNCPVSRSYTDKEFLELSTKVGLTGSLFGCSITLSELNLISSRTEALCDSKFPKASREFLYNLSFDNKGRPIHEGQIAGLGACFHLTKTS